MENYEEKYENLIEKLKKAKEEHGGYTFSSVIDKIVPELKESEDERIRKDIIAFIKENYSSAKSWIAWLEKQGKTQVRTGVEWVNTIDNACDERYAEEYAHGEYCHEQSFKWGFQEGVDWLENQRKEWNADDLLKCNQIIDILQEYNRTELIAWLEKQGKQDALKGLPKWKKVDSNPPKLQYNLQGKRLYKDGEYYIELSDLETLPKEE